MNGMQEEIMDPEPYTHRLTSPRPHVSVLIHRRREEAPARHLSHLASRQTLHLDGPGYAAVSCQVLHHHWAGEPALPLVPAPREDSAWRGGRGRARKRGG